MSSAITRTIINTPNAPEALGPYNQAVRVGNTVYLSGSLGLAPGQASLVEGGVTPEAHQALKNMGEILKAAGCSYNSVVKTTIFLADMADFSAVNDVYKQYFKENYPARSTFQVAGLPKNGRVEIEAVAVVGDL
ncbi:endoribonuclease l-PSP domain-containing protein [Ditylenchus destructor]|uniref:Endoribonuclease l-PSP domain-containing protein n=1 Tax=Ditylenchus destructor TaxID=166010 RepID=A0AAD4NE22_9BILA|nr:endoribonuclease l-PSP domain-containing protein [Ditylenchus destructor]